ncbi:unnamed protein product [Boreogadus saida]
MVWRTVARDTAALGALRQGDTPLPAIHDRKLFYPRRAAPPPSTAERTSEVARETGGGGTSARRSYLHAGAPRWIPFQSVSRRLVSSCPVSHHHHGTIRTTRTPRRNTAAEDDSLPGDPQDNAGHGRVVRGGHRLVPRVKQKSQSKLHMEPSCSYYQGMCLPCQQLISSLLISSERPKRVIRSPKFAPWHLITHT